MRRQALAIAMAAVVLGACSGPEAPPAESQEKTPATVRLAVAGAVNGMPSLAVSGDRVVAVWTATSKDAMNVYAAVSENGGVSFSDHRRVNDQDGDVSANAEQPPRVAIGSTGITIVWPSKKSGNSAICMARSTDGGQTFGAAVTIHDPSLQGARGWEALTSAADGSIHAVWLDGRDAVRMTDEEATKRHASEGHNHEAMKQGTMNHAGMGSMNASPRQDVYQAVIGADGKITETHVARDVCFCCKTAIGIGPSGRINIAWRHIFPGSMRDIAMAISTDGGRRFGPLVRVSEDKWELSACPDDGPSMAVDGSDSVHLVWPTLVNQTEPQKAIFYTITRDGTSFAPRVRISGDDQMDAAHPQVGADRAGNAAVVWDEPQGDRRVVMIRMSPAGSGRFGAPRRLSEGEGGHHPFIVPAATGFLVAWTSGQAEKSAIMLHRVGDLIR
jgi:hypothetical protein